MLEWWNSFSNWMPVCASENDSCGIARNGFFTGYLSGLLLFVLSVLVVFLIYLMFFRPKRLTAIVIPGEHGSLQISAQAISDLVKSLDPEFKHIEILKVSLYQQKRRIWMNVLVNYQPGGDSMPEISNMLQERILNTLKDSFGIISVKQICLQVKRAPCAAGAF